VSDPDLTPAEEQVRRLLADARHDEPMPADVSDRLDRVLADLQGEAGARRTPPPVDLASRRRRRNARNLLVAAAAVVALGVGISRVDLGGQGDADAGSSSGSASDTQSSPLEDDAGGSAASPSAAGPRVRLRSEDFEQAVRRLQATRGLSSLTSSAAPQSSAGGDPEARTNGVPGCAVPGTEEGQQIPVTYDGQPGVLVLRPPAGGTRDVDLYLCGEPAATRSVTVPVG
jgi:hypothetical protein